MSCQFMSFKASLNLPLQSPRCASEHSVVGAREGRVVLETGREAGFRQGHAVLYFIPCKKQALCIDVFSNAVAGLLLKNMHEVAAADKELL